MGFESSSLATNTNLSLARVGSTNGRVGWLSDDIIVVASLNGFSKLMIASTVTCSSNVNSRCLSTCFFIEGSLRAKVPFAHSLFKACPTLSSISLAHLGLICGPCVHLKGADPVF